MIKRIICVAIISYLFLSCLSSVFNFSYAESKVKIASPKKHWAEKDVTKAVYERWAYTNGTVFYPDRPAAREEVVWMLIGACQANQINRIDINKKADLSKYKDSPSPNAKERMAVAVGNGIITGYKDGKLRSKSGITRAELAVVLSRLINEGAPAGFLPFWDYIPKWAYDGIKKTHATGVVSGYPGGSFKADSGVTRAEALVMIMRWKERYNKLHGIPEEFRQITHTVKNTQLVNGIVIYYKSCKPESEWDLGSFYILDGEKCFTMVINETDQTVLTSAKETLKVFYPKQYETVFNLVNQINSNGEEVKEEKYDNRYFMGKNRAINLTLYIGKK